MGNDILTLTAAEQVSRLARRELSSEELTRLYLERIERLNSSLQAFVRVYPARALAAARSKDRQAKRGGKLPPLHGLPMGIKDLNFVRGMVTRMGSRGFWLLSPIDDLTTRALRAGGCVILGKTATSEVGALPVTEPDVHPPTRNPWNPAHTSGGSSGGAGAAVAAGLLPMAHGSDGGGSVRIPSALCHLYGLKPSRGRLRNAYGLDDTHIMYTCGPLARTVGDAALMLDVMAGISVGKPHRLPPPPRPYAELWREEPKGPLRIGLNVTSPHAVVDPRAADAARGVARLLERHGHRVEERPPPPADIEEFMPVWQKLVSQAPLLRWSKAQPTTAWLGAAGKRHHYRRDVLPRMIALCARVEQWLAGLDLLVTPTVPFPAPRVGEFQGLPAEEVFARTAPLGAFTAMFNVGGQPAANVPAGLTAEGLPLGVQLVGQVGREDLVLQVSRLLEEEMPWKGKWAAGAGLS